MRFNPETALEGMVQAMASQMSEAESSSTFMLPFDRELAKAYREMGEKPSFDMVAPYDPLDTVPDIMRKIYPHADITPIIRDFKPGEGEGTHTDDYDQVLTITLFGRAEFTHAGSTPQLLKPNHCILFNPRMPHEVSAPLGGGRRRIVAFAMNHAL